MDASISRKDDTLELSLADMAGSYVIDNLRSQLKSKTIRDAELSESARAKHEEVTVLVDELAKEKKARKRLEQQLDLERTKLLELRGGYEAKGTQEASCKRAIYMLQNKLDSTMQELEEREKSKQNSDDAIKSAEDKVREFRRTIKDVGFDIMNKQKELEKLQTQNFKLAHTLKRLDASTRATDYEKKIEIQNLEKTYQFKSQEVDKLRTEYESCDRNVKALTEIIKTGAENFNLEKAKLMEDLDEANARAVVVAQETTAIDQGYEKLKDVLKEGLAREKLLQQHLQDSAELRAELNLDLNEKQRQQAIYENSIQEKLKRKSKWLDELAESKQTVALAREKLLNHETALAVISKEYSTASERALLLSKNSAFDAEQDDMHVQKLQHHSELQRTLERDLETNEGVITQLQQQLIGAHTKLDIVKSDRHEAVKHRDELEGLIDKHMKEGENLTALLATKQVEWKDASERTEGMLKELTDTADSLHFANDKLDKVLLLKEKENENLDMLECQVRQDRETENEDLKFRINDYNCKIGELHRELMDYSEKKRDFEAHLQDLQPEVEKLEKILEIKRGVECQERAMQEQEVAKRQNELDSLVGAHSRDVEETAQLRDQIQSITARCDSYETKNDGHEKEWRKQRQKTTALSDRYNEITILQSEYEANLTALRNDCEHIEKRLNEVTNNSIALTEQLSEAESDNDLTKLKLRDQAVSREEYQKEMAEGKRALHSLERQLKIKEGNFKVYAITVAQQIRDLQSALVERVEGAERLSQGLQVSETSNEGLRGELIRVHEEMEEAKFDSERVLEEKREDVGALYASLGQAKVQEVTLSTQLARKIDEVSQQQLQLKMQNDKVVVTKNELDVTRDKIAFLRLKADRQNNKMAELQNTTSSKIAMIGLLQKQIGAKRQVQRSLEKQVRAIQHEKGILKEKESELLAKHEQVQVELERVKVKFGERLVSQSEGPMALLIQHLKTRKAANDPLKQAYKTS